MEHELGVIGGGNMAEACVRGLLNAGLLTAERIVVSDVSAERRERLARTGATCTADNKLPARCQRVLLAVKPQVLPGVLDEVSGEVRPDATVVSIAAGVKAAGIARRLGGRGRIVRVMPNTPMLVGEGAAAVSAGPGATEDDLAWTEQAFAVSGRTVRVDESLMDAVTAVSGSGPAYFFYLIEAMVAAGVAEGLDEATATLLASQTCAGAARLLLESNEKPAVLRARVTSPNGTTQRAIETMDAAGVRDALVRGVRAAAERSRELGR